VPETIPGKKKPLIGERFFQVIIELLQLHFLVFHMLASFWIKLADQHFLGHRFLVLGCGVEVAGTRSGFQFDFFTSAFCHDFFS
jgi:hypothetical protein